MFNVSSVYPTNSEKSIPRFKVHTSTRLVTQFFRWRNDLVKEEISCMHQKKVYMYWVVDNLKECLKQRKTQKIAAGEERVHSVVQNKKEGHKLMKADVKSSIAPRK